jgi:hypothetical protein
MNKSPMLPKQNEWQYIAIFVSFPEWQATGGWRKLHNEELHNLYSLPNIIKMIKSRRMRWARHVARMEEKRNAYRILVGKQEGTRPLGSPRHW